MRMNVGVQLYTLRNETEKDFLGTLEKIADIGYEGVEFAGCYGGLKAHQIKDCLDRLGLKPAGSHVGIDLLRSDLDEVIEFSLEIGNKYIVCPWDRHDSWEGWHEAAKLYKAIGEKCNEKGLKFCYHNHSHEFKKYNDKYAIDIIFNETNPECVLAEIDTYWVQYAGINPKEYLRKFKGRMPLLHQKDMGAGEERATVEVGEGIMDIYGISAVAEEIGAEWLIVEQDDCSRPPLESIKISFENLKKMKLI
ncbi:MAG: sugar phosphate isomerase/epimerase [Clostridia bacterium]|nr:sugar phosphate isomerase/epimerase [Clostridia bacterium]